MKPGPAHGTSIAQAPLSAGPRGRGRTRRRATPGVTTSLLTMGVDMHRPLSDARRLTAGAILLPLALVPAVPAAAAATQVKPGFNVFSTEQDIETGRQSAVEAERQLPLLNDRATQEYVESVFSRLAA